MLSNAVWRLNSQGFARESKVKLEELQWLVRERENCSGAPGSGSGRSKLCDHCREKRRYKYPSGPNGRISVVEPHLTRGTAALKVRHCRTCQDSKGQDLNRWLSPQWLEDILVGIVSTWLHIKACALYPPL
jgi:hypothetical protein